MNKGEHDEDNAYDDDETLYLEEDDDGRGKLQVFRDWAADGVMQHPRFALGGGSLFVSFAVDCFFRFDLMIVAMGVGAVTIIAWKADDLIEGAIHLLAPGSDQEQTREIASHIADHALADYPVYTDQSIGAKLRRLIGLGDREVVEGEAEEPGSSLPAPKRALPPKREVVAQSREDIQHYKEGRETVLVERAMNLLEDGIINDKQFFVLLDRIDSRVPLSRSGESGERVKGPERPGESGESPVKFNSVSPTVSPQDELLIARTAFRLIGENGHVTREEIKTALGWNNKRHGEIKVICDKYGIAMPGGK